MGHTVWWSGDRTARFHSTPTCFRVSNGKGATLREVELAEIKRPVPCARCYPRAPRLKVWHPLCLECGHTKPVPCAHNGAVLARVPRYGQWTGKFGDTDWDPDMIDPGDRWVWPENAWRYTLVDSAHLT